MSRSVTSNYNISVDFCQLKSEIAHFRTGDTFLQRIVPSRHEVVMFLLFIGGFTTLTKQQHHFYLFDSHSRDEGGLRINGRTSILLKFFHLKQVEKCIHDF